MANEETKEDFIGHTHPKTKKNKKKKKVKVATHVGGVFPPETGRAEEIPAGGWR